MENTSREFPVNSRLYVSSDLEVDRRSQEERQNVAEQALEAVGKLLNDADGMLEGLEEDPEILGSALVRGCIDLADAIGSLAQQLDQQSDDDRRALAQACLEDAAEVEKAMSIASGQEPSSSSQLLNSSREMTSMSEDDIMLALSGAEALLRDVEFSLRSIDRHDADEIADVALTLARLFLISLQNFHATVTPAELLGTQQQQTGGGLEVELLDPDPAMDDDTVPNKSRSAPDATKSRKDRVRILWPPLGPSVASACEWGKDEASKKPLLSVAMGITLWPAAVMTVMVGTPLVLADGLLQNVYTSFSNAPLVENLERGAAQLYQAGRLSLLSGKLVCRQTLRVVKRQVDRHGGMEKVAHDLGGVVVDRILHPIETAGLAWNGIAWGVGTVQEAIKNVQKMAEQRETDATATYLH